MYKMPRARQLTALRIMTSTSLEMLGHSKQGIQRDSQLYACSYAWCVPVPMLPMYRPIEAALKM